jgi:hypothetical protein
MKTLSDFFGKTLMFIQPSIWKRAFELRDGNEIIGTLTYPKFFSVKADANIFATKWEFYEPKWWKNLIEIREAGRELPIASLKPSTFKKKEKLELPHGESVFVCSSFFRTTFEIQDRYEKRIVVFNNKIRMKLKIEIQIEKRSEILDKYPWILLFVVYIELNKKRQRSAG